MTIMKSLIRPTRPTKPGKTENTVDPQLLQHLPGRNGRPSYIITNTDRIVDYENDRYLLLLPPRTASRSIYSFFIKKKILTNIPTARDFMSNHDPIQDNFVGKVVVSTRHPLDRALSGYFLARLVDPHLTIDKMIVMLGDYDASILPGLRWHDNTIITNLLRGRTADYVIRTETLLEDISKLPFVEDVSHFPHIREHSTLEERAKLRNYIISNREFAEKINTVFHLDFVTFGYDKI